MKHRLFEFEDLSWFPDTIREGMTDYLRYFLGATDFYGPVAPVIREAMKHAGTDRILDLCSGSGGAIRLVRDSLATHVGQDVPVTLTDKYPNLEAFRLLREQTGGRIDYVAEPVDATAVPADLEGLRTIFSGFHHFDPETAARILEQTAASGKAIAVFDGGDRNILTILGIILFHPIIFLLATPFFRPFRLSRLLFTYLLPLIPLCTVWDGVVSILRLYTPGQMMALAAGGNCGGGYHWQSGRLRNRLGMHINFLVGYPAQAASPGTAEEY